VIPIFSLLVLPLIPPPPCKKSEHLRSPSHVPACVNGCPRRNRAVLCIFVLGAFMVGHPCCSLDSRGQFKALWSPAVRRSKS
jgi:hypothetical protein